MMSRGFRIAALLVVAGLLLCQSVLAGYADPKGRFTIDPPEGWKVQAAPDGSSVVFVTEDDQARLIALALDVPDNTPLADVAAGYEQFLKQAKPDSKMKLQKETKAEVAGQPALQREYVIEEGGKDIATVRTIFLRAGTFSLTLHTSVRGEGFEKFEPVFHKCLGSLCVTPKQAAGAPTDVQEKLKALQAAHEAGVLSKTEYERKKAELEAQLRPPQPQLDEATQKKLQALEAARQAGVLSQAEYDRKKAELLRSAAPELDEATKSKLKALDAARQAGVLSQAEFERKKAELLGQPAAGQPEPEGPADFALYRDPQGRFQLQHPRTWAAQAFPNGQGVAFMSGTNAISLLLVSGAATADQILDGIAANLGKQWKDYREAARTQCQVGGAAAPLADFTGTNPQGMRARGQLTVAVAGGTGYVFILTVPENGLPAVQPVWNALLGSFRAGAGTAAPEVAAVKGKTYRHAAGFSFSYPDAWSVKEQDGNVQLIPPDPASANGAPLELYFVAVENVAQEGIQRPDDPRIVQLLDTQVKSLSAALARVGEAAPVNMGAAKGVVLNWEARSPQAVIAARVFVGIVNGWAAAIVGMGVKEKVDARDADLRRIFGSFGVPAAGQPGAPAPQPDNEPRGQAPAGPLDQRLLGCWLHEKNFSSGTYGSTTARTFVFRADGTFLTQGQFAASTEHREAGSPTPERTTMGSDVSKAAGRWSAANGVLSLAWAGGDRDQVRYYIEDPSQPGTTAATMGKRLMLVTTEDGEKQLWTHQR